MAMILGAACKGGGSSVQRPCNAGATTCNAHGGHRTTPYIYGRWCPLFPPRVTPVQPTLVVLVHISLCAMCVGAVRELRLYLLHTS